MWLYTQYSSNSNSSQAVWFTGTRVMILKVNNSRMIQSNFGSKGPNGFRGLEKKSLQMTSDGKRSHDHFRGRSGGLKVQ